MCIPLEPARAATRRESLPSVTCLDLLSPDGSIDLTNPLVRLMPIATLALAVATAAVRKAIESAATTSEVELQASLAGEVCSAVELP